jgi:hypothetical protein
LQFVNGGHKTVLAAKGLNELQRRAERIERGYAQHVGVIEVQHPLIGIFGKQRVQHDAGLRTVFREDVALFDILCALTPGQRLPVEGDVADEIEGIEVLAEFVGYHVERQTFGFQLVDDRLLALRQFPALEKIIEADEALFQRLLREIAQGFGDQPTSFVEIFDTLGDNGGANAIDINLFLAAAGGRR